MNAISQAQKDANRLGFTGVLPNGAKGITKDGDTFSVTLADGTVQKYNKDGSIFTPPADTTAKPADNGNKADGATAKTGVDNSGKGNGATGTGNAGNTGNSVFGNGFSQASDMGFGMSGFNMNGSFNIDPNKFMGASAGLWGALNLTSLVPLGLGSILGQGMIGKAISNFANAVGFNFDYSKYFAEYDAQHGKQNGTTVTAGDGQPDTSGTTETSTTSGTTTTEKPEAKPAETQAEKPTEQAQAPASSGGSSGASDASATKASQSTHATTSAKKKHASSGASSKPKAKTEAELAKDGGYTKLTNGKYRKNGQIYEFKNGKFTYFADNTFNDGRFVKDGKVYNSNGTPSSNTVAMGNAPTMHTLTHFLNDGNEYKQGSYRGMTTLTSKDGTVTRYFDSTGKLVQTNQKDNGGFFGDPINTVNRYEYNKIGVLRRREESDVLKNKTVTTEYNLSGLKAGKTTQNKGVHTEQRMDSQGRVSTYKYQEITTVEVVNYKGKQRRITTVVKQPVK